MIIPSSPLSQSRLNECHIYLDHNLKDPNHIRLQYLPGYSENISPSMGSCFILEVRSLQSPEPSVFPSPPPRSASERSPVQLNHGRTAGCSAGRWEGFDVSAVFIRVSGSLCSLSIMEEAISPASRPHHKNVSWYKETRWIITRRDSRCSPSLSLCLPLSASLIASVSLIDCLVYFSLFLPRLVFIPLIFLLSLFPLMRLFFSCSLSLSLSQRLQSH